ncbi:MAG: hypothetical protein Q4D11_06330 [Rhodospirillales bacterium]|nr:hypothetical protein [Rhodospirillales bacterium]
MSKSAKQIQHFANNILINAIKHSAKLPPKGYSQLPSTRQLACNNPKEHLQLAKAFYKACAIRDFMNKLGKQQILKTSALANMQYVSIVD